MKPTPNSGKIYKLNRKVIKESVKAIGSISFFCENLTYNPLTLISEPMQLCILEYCVKIPKGTKITKKSIQKFKKKYENPL